MTLELWLFGVQVMCFTIGASDAGAEPDELRDLGYTGGYFMAPIARPEIPDEATIHHQCSPYEDDSEAGRG